MLGVLINSLKTAFSTNKFQMGAFFAMIIGMSDVSFFNISAPLWAINGSLFVSLLVEKEDFAKKNSCRLRYRGIKIHYHKMEL